LSTEKKTHVEKPAAAYEQGLMTPGEQWPGGNETLVATSKKKEKKGGI
jgi:hypothetical protein